MTYEESPNDWFYIDILDVEIGIYQYRLYSVRNGGPLSEAVPCDEDTFEWPIIEDGVHEENATWTIVDGNGGDPGGKDDDL